jgi:hypothetical protein
MEQSYSRVQLYSSNVAMMQLRESTVSGLAIDPDINLILACTDFGHILIHSLDGSVEKSKTLRSKWAPFYSMQLCIIGGEKSVLWYVMNLLYKLERILKIFG